MKTRILEKKRGKTPHKTRLRVPFMCGTQNIFNYFLEWKLEGIHKKYRITQHKFGLVLQDFSISKETFDHNSNSCFVLLRNHWSNLEIESLNF